jgi:adenylate cyclase
MRRCRPRSRRAVAETTQRRAVEGKPVTDMHLGLHVGKVFYGNVGSCEWLDFAIIAAEANRIAAMSRSVDQPDNEGHHFHSDLGERGYVEGRNVLMTFRWAEGRYNELGALADDLVLRRVASHRDRRRGAHRVLEANRSIPPNLLALADETIE